jgi:hypothetical protein
MFKNNNYNKIILIVTFTILILNKVLIVGFNYELFGKLIKRTNIKLKYIELLLLIIITILTFDIYIKYQNKLDTNSMKFPVQILEKKIPTNSTIILEIKTKPNSKIIYWLPNDLDNSGVINSDANGKSRIRLRKTNETKLFLRVEASPGILGHIDTVIFK